MPLASGDNPLRAAASEGRHFVREDETVRRALRSVQREAIPSSMMIGLTESFMIPYALALGATPFEAGMLSSVRNLILSVAQLYSVDVVRHLGSRRRLVLQTAMFQALLWIPLAFVAALFGKYAVPALILLYTLGTTSAAFGGPAWGSLVSDYLRPEERGRFFGRRTMVAGAWTTSAGLAAGGLLQAFSGRPVIGFALLCLAACAARVVSWRMLRKLHEEPWHEHPQARFTFRRFMRQLPTSNFARFAVAMSLMSFAVNLSAPYLAIYMLQEREYAYFTYTLITLAGSSAGFLGATRWGLAGDRFGNWVVLRWTLLGIATLPLLWPLHPHPLWLFMVNLAGGWLWGGLNLSMVNFVYDAASQPKRARCLSYFNVLYGCGASAGAFAGGWLVTHVPPTAGSVFVSLFMISSAARLLSALVFRKTVREVRPVHKAGLMQVLYDLVGQRLVLVLGLFMPQAGYDESSDERRATSDARGDKQAKE